MATLEERINNLAGDMTSQANKGAISNKEMEIYNQATSGMNPIDMVNKNKGAISDKEMAVFLNDNEMKFEPGSIEYNIEQIRKNMEAETQISPERQAFIEARQEIIDEILMPLADAGYKELVDTILTKPLESDAHNQASAMLAKVMQQEDPEFEMQDFDMMIKSVSKEPRPADLINPEGLPDAPPQAPEGISGLR
jgi:hypothetical protein|tara:strand:- start:719 stop:1303 length:585 start_codon:yes stop_codon:yes gene_type:complete